MNRRNRKLVWALVAEAAGADVSYGDRFELLNGALLAQFGNDAQGCQRFYVQDLFPAYLIARNYDGGQMYQIDYAIASDGSIKLGDAQQVETAYVPVAEAAQFAEVSEAEAASTDDGVYRVAVMSAGWSGGSATVGGSNVKMARYYPPEFVARVAEAINGAKFGRKHPQEGTFGEDDPDRIAGWYSDGTFAEGRAIANLNVLESETAMRAKLSAARKARKLDMFGLSILGTVGFRRGTIEGKQCLVAESLAKLYSVDLCSEAGAGGGFLEFQRVAASAAATQDIATLQASAVKQGHSVKPGRANQGDTVNSKLLILRVLEALKPHDAVAATGFQNELNSATEDKLGELLVRVNEALVTASANASAAARAEAERVNVETKKLQFVNVMEAALVESKLPEPAKKLVRRHFETVAGTKELLDAEIVTVREAFAATAGIGRVDGTVVPGLETEDKLQLAMDRLLGVREAQVSGVAAFRGLRDAYIHVTGDRDLRFAAVRESQAVTADFPNVLLNSFTKRLMQGWKDYGMAGLDQLYETAAPTNYLLQDRVRDGYFDEFATVAEGAPYLDADIPTDERVNYAIQKRGRLLTISEETIRNDNLGAIAKWPDKLVRAGLKTLKSYISGFYIGNTAYQADGVNWFDNTHTNLIATAFGYDALVAAEIALFSQTEKNSGEQLGLTLDWIMIPIQLKAAAIALNQTDTAGSNGFFHRFGPNNERIIVNEKLTDVNDWYYGTAKENAPCLEIGFLDGIQMPQIFLANNPLVGAAFTNDQIQYKAMFPFAGAITDYRGVGKAVVAG